MSNFPSYPTRSFSETQKFFVLDPQTGTPSFVLGSDLVNFLTPGTSFVFAESTRVSAQASNYKVGNLIQTAGAVTEGDGLASGFLVVPGGEGDFAMQNGNDLLVIRGDDLLREQLKEGVVRMPDLAAMESTPGRFNGDAARLVSGTGRDGDFRWDSSDLSSTLVLASATSDSVDDTTDTINDADHPFSDGDGVITQTTVNGLTAQTVYWVVNSTSGSYQLSATFGGGAIDLTGTTNVTIDHLLDPLQGVYITPSSDKTGASGAWMRPYDSLTEFGGLDPKWFTASESATAAQNAAAFHACLNYGSALVVITPSTYSLNPVTITNANLKKIKQLPGAVINGTPTAAGQWLFTFPTMSYFEWERPWLVSSTGKADGNNFGAVRFPQPAGDSGSSRISLGGENGRILDFSGYGIEAEQVVFCKVFDMELNCAKRNLSFVKGSNNGVPSTTVDLDHLYLFGAESSIFSDGTNAITLDEIVVESSGADPLGAINLNGGSALIGNIYFEACDKNYALDECRAVFVGDGFGLSNDNGTNPSTISFSGTAFPDRGVAMLLNNRLKIREVTGDPSANNGAVDFVGDVQFNGGAVYSGYDESDTWTPVIADAQTGGNASPTTGFGYYTKSGRQVTITVEFDNIDTTGLTAGNGVYIQGLPFTSINTGPGAPYFTAAIMTASINYGGTGVIANIRRNWDAIELLVTDPAATSLANALTVSTLTSGSADMKFSLTYFI